MLQSRAVTADAPGLREALEAANLPTEDLCEAGRTFFAFDEAGQKIGYGGFELYGSDALLRSVVVLTEKRGKGYGHLVSESVLKEAFDRGARNAYLLTTTAERFFEREGFEKIDRKAAPASILETKQASTICSSVALLARTLAFHD